VDRPKDNPRCSDPSPYRVRKLGSLLRCRRSLRIGDGNHKVFVTGLLEGVGAVFSGRHDITFDNVVDLAVENVAASNADDVADIVMAVLMRANGRASMQDALAEGQSRIRRFGKMRIRRSFSVAAVRTWLYPCGPSP
jgi:hypothetical protein